MIFNINGSSRATNYILIINYVILQSMSSNNLTNMFNKSIELSTLEGKWHIILSNFPMWLKGDKTNPTFNYTIAKRNDILGLTDEVKYEQNGKIKSINGFDTPLNANNSCFEWRGKGILSLLTSRWEILYLDTNWAIIHFEKTLFTPKGYDVICREKNLEEATNLKIAQKLKELKISVTLHSIY